MSYANFLPHFPFYYGAGSGEKNQNIFLSSAVSVEATKGRADMFDKSAEK